MGDVISKRSDEFSEKKCPLPTNDQVQDQLQCSVANMGSNDVWTAVTVSKENGVLTREGKTFHIVAGKQSGDVLLVPTNVSLGEGENTCETRIEEHCTPHTKVTGHPTTIPAQEELNPSTSQSRDRTLMDSKDSSESGQLPPNPSGVPDRTGDYGLEENANEEIELTENELVALFRYNMLADATNVLKTLKTDLSVRTGQPAGTRHSKDKSPTHLPPVHHGNQLTSSVPTKEALLAMSGNSPPDSLPHLKTKRTDRQNNAGISLLKPRSIMIGGPSSNSMWSDTPKSNHPPEDKPGLVKRVRAAPTKLWKQSSVDKKTSPNILPGKPHPPLRRSPAPPLKSPQQSPSAALATSPSKSGPLSPNNHVSKYTMSFPSSGKEVYSSTKTVLSKGNKITLSAIDHDLLKSSNPSAIIARGDQKSKNSSYLTGPSPFARPDALSDKMLSMYSEVEDLRGFLRDHLNLMEGQPKDRGIIKVDQEEEPAALEVVTEENYMQEAIDAAVMIQKHFRRYRTQKELVKVKKSVNAIQKMFKKWYCKSKSSQAPVQSSYSSRMSETSDAEVSGIVTSDTARQVIDKGELSKLMTMRTLGDIPEEIGQGSCQTANPDSEDRNTGQEPGKYPEATQKRDDNHGNSNPSSESTVVNPESGTNSKLILTKWNSEFNVGVQNPANPKRPMRAPLATTHQFGQLSTLADRLRGRLSWTESAHRSPAVQDDNKAEESVPNSRKMSVVMAKKAALGKGIQSKKDFFDGYRAEIDRNIQLMNEMAELALGEDYEPRKVLLISSKVPKYERLAKSAHPDVITIVYDHEEATLTSILTEIQDRLNSYRQGAKIKSMAISCKGTPGCFYILARRPVTPAKLRMDAEMRMFWQLLGTFMSSLGFGQPTTLHLMESNCAGNKQGEELLEVLADLMQPALVNVESPLEISKKGHGMIETYFNPLSFKMWKSQRYTKLKLF